MMDLTPSGKPTPRLRARVLREELESRLLRLQDLAHELRDSAGKDAQARADAVNSAIEYLESAMNALTLASSTHTIHHD